MPSATAFKYHKQFSPLEHCIEDATTADLDSTGNARWEGTLAEVMALWWNLYKVDVFISVDAFGGPYESTVTSFPVKNNTLGDDVFGLEALDDATPVDRVCADFNERAIFDIGLALGTPTTSPFDDGNGDDCYFQLKFVRVNYNTDTSKYALQFSFLLGQGVGTERFSSYSIGNSTVANGGTSSFLGQSTPATTYHDGGADVSMSITNAVYYTF